MFSAYIVCVTGETFDGSSLGKVNYWFKAEHNNRIVKIQNSYWNEKDKWGLHILAGVKTTDKLNI